MAEPSTIQLSKNMQSRIAKEFKKSFFHDWDLQFVGILILSIFFEAALVLILSQRPVDIYTDQEIARIQERYVNFVLKEKVKKETVIGEIGPATEVGEGVISQEAAVEKAGGEGEGTGDGTGGEGERRSAEVRQAARMAAAEARRISRERMSQEVSNKGLLRLLTGTGSAAHGEGVSSFFVDNGSGVGDDLDRVLSGAGGLKTQGTSGFGGGAGGGGQAARGTRSGEKASIDDLVSDLGSVGSGQLSRSGELKVEAPSEVGGRGRASIHRSPDAIHEVLLSHVPAIRYCYERELKRDPALKGKIVVRITVTSDGSVSDAEIISSTLNSDRVERCILARIRLWKDFKAIDPREGEVTFRQVYTFGY